MKKHLPLILTLLIWATQVMAQNQASLSGSVSDQTGYLPGVNVLVMETSQGSPTDLNGKFEIANLPAGKATLRISYLG